MDAESIQKHNEKCARDKWESMVKGSREAVEEFQDLCEDSANIWADDRIKQLEREMEIDHHCNKIQFENIQARVKALEGELKLALADRLNCGEPPTKAADTMTKNCGNCGYRVDPEKRLHNQPACERPIDNIDDSCRAYGKWIPQQPPESQNRAEAQKGGER